MAGAPSGEIRSGEIAVGDFVFDARFAGPESGEAVFLLHGFPQTSYEWRAQLTALGEAGYFAVAPDQRGYSPRARPPNVEDYAIPLLVQDVFGMADSLGVDRFHVVGHDWGAAVAWVVAASSTERVQSLTAMSVPHPDAFRQVLSDMNSCQYEASSYFDLFSAPDAEDGFLANDAAFLRGFFTGLPDDAVEEYVRVLGTKEALSAALNWYRANVENRLVTGPELGLIEQKTLFFWSDQDVALCRDGADLTAQFVSGPYQFEILEGIGHWIPDEAPAEVNRLLLEHLP